MNDHDRQRAHGPLQPMEPDAWHDRPTRLLSLTKEGWALCALFILGLAAVINALVRIGEVA